MSIPSRDTSKKGTVTRSQSRKDPILAREIEKSSQGPLQTKQKTLRNTDKTLHIFENGK